MSIKVASDEITRFLASPDPEVLCITGQWGVGKTYAWNHYLKTAQVVALEDYAYVSLFGQNSLQDVRNSIFENTEFAKPVTAQKDKSRWKEKGERIGRELAKYREIVASFGAGGAVAIGERLMFASLKPQIVCIDDLERAGDSLSKRDVLGLITQLKEQKKCKIVMLLNANALGKDQDEFNQQIEKVADSIIAFEPTPIEAAEIGISQDAPESDLLRQHCAKLGISNIRVIKRIEAASRRLQTILGNHDPRILKQAMHTAALFTFSRYQPDLAPSVDFIRDRNRILDLAENEQGNSDWRALLDNYEFGYADEFDLVVAQGVVSGHFSSDLLREYADRQQATLALQDLDGSFQEAWNRYHYSFDDDQEEVLDEMAEAFKKSVAAISPLNAAGTAQFFEDLGRAAQGRELAEYYVENRDEPQEFWDLSQSIFGSEIKNPTIRELFRRKHDSIAPPLEDPATILLRIREQSGWNQRDIDRLATVTEDEFFALFKAPHGKNLTRITAEAMRFQSRGPIGSSEHNIYLRANAALDRIAAESAINDRRVRQHRSRG